MNPKKRDDIKIGARVIIKDSQNNFIEGTVKVIITKVFFHNDGIKVELDDNSIGRVQKIIPLISEEQVIATLTSDFRRQLNLDESTTLEFKSSLLFDYREFDRTGNKQIDRKGPHSIAKTIAAFANTDGGTLYIGIHNQTRNILGLKNDYDLLSHTKDSDEFLFKLKNSMVSLLGQNFFYCVSLRRVLHLSEGDICVIVVKSSKKPLIVKWNNENQLYVRDDDDSIQYTIEGFIEHWIVHIKKLETIS